MMCDKCGRRRANVHVTQVVNGVKFEQDLCTECAMEKAQESRRQRSGLEQLMEVFQRMGLVGVVVSHGEQGTAAQRAGGGEHPGHPDLEELGLTIPGEGTESSPAMDLERLRAELTSAVAHERFERAAELRDEIYAREQALGGEEN